MKRTFGLLASLALSLLLTACGSDSDSDSKPQAPTAVISLLAPSEAAMPIKQPITVQLDGSDSSTPNDGNLSYRWTLVERPATSAAVLSSTDTVGTEFVAEVAGSYVASLIVNDGQADSVASRFTFTAIDPKPIAKANTTINVALGTDSVGLDGSNSTLPAGLTGQLEYQWTLKEKPRDSISNLLNDKSSTPTLSLDVAGEYKVELVVSFDGLDSDPLTVVVTVFEGNTQPVAKVKDMEGTQHIMGQKVSLDATESSDADGDNLQYHWRMSDAPFEDMMPVLNNQTTATPDFTPAMAGEYELKLFVFDGQRASEEITVTVVVDPDPAATANLAPEGELVATGYYPSRSVGEQEVGLRAEFNFIGYDPEGETLQIVDAELIEKPVDSNVELVNIGSWKPLGKKIQKLDVAGTYRVRMTVSDGVNQVSREATMEAKVGGVNNRPSTGSLDADSQAVLVGQPLIFNASSSDKDGDPLTYEWTLIDKPDGSNAVITPVTHPENKDLSRAEVMTDIPGVYRVHLIVKDDRGLYSSYDREETGYAKTENKAPEIHSVVWARNWGRLAPGENFYQILPCMSLLHRPIVIDPDGDEVFTHNELISVPANGGNFTSYPDEADCPNTRGQVFTKPGTYVFRYYATDILADAPNYDFVVKVDSFENARGVRLKSVSSRGDLWRPLPYENIPTDRYVFSPSGSPIEASAINWSMTAVDGDYTIENVQVKHINGGLNSLTPAFDGLEEGTVIKKGESLDFQTQFPAIPCLRTDEGKEGFHLSFNIKEIPEISFTYETWMGASTFMSTWTECQPGQLD